MDDMMEVSEKLEQDTPPSPPEQFGDVNGDGLVDFNDMLALMQAFGTIPGNQNWNERADLNSDGVVDVLDFEALRRLLVQG